MLLLLEGLGSHLSPEGDGVKDLPEAGFIAYARHQRVTDEPLGALIADE